MGKLKTGFYILGTIFLIFVIVSHIFGGNSQPFSSQPLTNETLNKFVSGQTLNEGDNKTATVTNGHVTVNYAESDGSFYDEKSLVTFMAEDAENIVPQLFANPNVNEITLTHYVKFTNGYGQSTMKPAISITFTRETNNKINWEGMKDKEGQEVFMIADSYYIEPSIYLKMPSDISLEQSYGNNEIA